MKREKPKGNDLLKNLRPFGRLIASVVLFAVPFFSYAQNPYDCPFCYLNGKNFSGQNLTNANFSGATLDSADFSNCVLNGAMFSNASLINANFTNAILDPSSFGAANLSGSNLSNAIFRNASMKGAVLEYTNIAGTDFTQANLTDALPGFTLFHTGTNNAAPNFTGTYLSCDYRRFEQMVNLSQAVFPSCDNIAAIRPLSVYTVGKAEQPKDLTQPTKVLITFTRSDTTGKNKAAQQTSAETDKKVLAANDTIYVASSGGDSPGCGSLSSPCKTIGQAIISVNTNGTVIVDYGQYPFTSTVSIAKSLTLIGGYSSGQPSLYQSQITAPQNGIPAFNINGSGTTVTLSNFIINSTVATSQNLASMGVQVTGSASVTIRNTNINSAKGGPGATGGQGTVGSTGGVGGSASGGTGGSSGTSACGNNSGGAGGNQTSKVSSDCDCSTLCFKCTAKITYYGFNGGSGMPGTTGSYTNGSAYAGGVNYLCPDTDRPSNAANGDNGAAAGCGSGGGVSTNVLGSFSSAVWLPSIGGTGASGGNGAGGGGGGCGGMCHYCNCVCGGNGDFYAGTPGGGGGGGGCGAQGGIGGTQGGASFGIVLQSATCVLDGTVKITSGAGGNGGSGGSGNSGGLGGAGGAAVNSNNVCNSTGSQGGNGGKGGTGGASGGGAGGNGGPAIGIATVGTCSIVGTPVYYQGQSGNIGTGGAAGTQASGGICNGVKGTDGLSGNVSNTQQY